MAPPLSKDLDQALRPGYASGESGSDDFNVGGKEGVEGALPAPATARELDAYPGKGTPAGGAAAENKSSLLARFLYDGGHTSDAFLTAASAQVGQVILNLPNSMAKLGLAGGILTQLAAASAAVYTLWLLSALYHEFKRSALKKGRWFSNGSSTQRDVVTQYHSVVTGTSGSRALGEFARVVNIIELIGLSVAQIIASASNFYSLGTGLDKRTFTFIFGAIATSLMAIPSFRNVRALTLLALIGTTYTSWYMMGSSWAHGLKPYAAALQPTSIENIFAATSNILFTFGGHCMLLEVLDSQFRPSKFPKTFSFALIYVTSTLTLPNAIFTYLAFPEESLEYGNAFAIFPNSPAKSVGIVLMVAHQLVAYILFMLPVAIMVEKLCRVHHKGYALRVTARIPLALFVWFLALLLPFFGVINDLLGAFAVSFETYIIPCFAYTLYYAGNSAAKRARRANAVVQPPRWFPWSAVFGLNAAITLGALIVGLGFGGYASVTALIESVGKFGLFAKCYNC